MNFSEFKNQLPEDGQEIIVAWSDSETVSNVRATPLYFYFGTTKSSEWFLANKNMSVAYYFDDEHRPTHWAPWPEFEE